MKMRVLSTFLALIIFGVAQGDEEVPPPVVYCYEDSQETCEYAVLDADPEAYHFSCGGCNQPFGAGGGWWCINFGNESISPEEGLWLDWAKKVLSGGKVNYDNGLHVRCGTHFFCSPNCRLDNGVRVCEEVLGGDYHLQSRSAAGDMCPGGSTGG